MEALYRYISGVILSLGSLFTPITPLIWCVVAFIAVDFLSGVYASRHRAEQNHKAWYFESAEAWRTLHKLGFAIIAVAMAWLIDEHILDFMELNLARLFAGFVCGVELWSFLENASQISDAQLFEWMRRCVHRRIRKEVDDE